MSVISSTELPHGLDEFSRHRPRWRSLSTARAGRHHRGRGGRHDGTGLAPLAGCPMSQPPSIVDTSALVRRGVTLESTVALADRVPAARVLR